MVQAVTEITVENQWNCQARYLSVIKRLIACQNHVLENLPISTETTSLRIVVMTAAPSRLLKVIDCSHHCLVGIASDQIFMRESRCKEMLREGWQVLHCSPSLKRWASRHGVPYHRFSTSEMVALKEWLQDLKPDLLITCKAPLLPESVFTVPRRGSINIHHALLPAYRGGSPLLWQVVNGEQRGGVTFHFIDNGIDTGPMLRQSAIELPVGLSERELELILDRLAAHALTDVIEAIANGAKGLPWPCDAKGEMEAPNVHFPSLIEFIDWEHWPIEKIWRVLRHMEFWPADHGIPPGWKRHFRWKVGQVLSRRPQSGSTGWQLETRGRHLQVRAQTGTIDLKPRVHLPTMLRGSKSLV